MIVGPPSMTALAIGQALRAWKQWRHDGDLQGGASWERLAKAMKALEAFQSYESCSWCHRLNPLSEDICPQCQHMAHVPRVECQCDACEANRRADMERVIQTGRKP